jgi:hypothetical protein
MNKENIVLNLESAEEKLKIVFLNTQNQEVRKRSKHLLDRVTGLKYGVKEEVFK